VRNSAFGAWLSGAICATSFGRLMRRFQSLVVCRYVAVDGDMKSGEQMRLLPAN